MKIQTIEFEKKGENGYFVEVTVAFNGDIIAATQYNTVFHSHDDCLERIQNDEDWVKKIDKEWSELDWSSDDWKMEALKEIMAPPSTEDLKMVGNG